MSGTTNMRGSVVLLLIWSVEGQTRNSTKVNWRSTPRCAQGFSVWWWGFHLQEERHEMTDDFSVVTYYCLNLWLALFDECRDCYSQVLHPKQQDAFFASHGQFSLHRNRSIESRDSRFAVEFHRDRPLCSWTSPWAPWPSSRKGPVRV